MSFAYNTVQRRDEVQYNTDLPDVITSKVLTKPHIKSQVSVRSNPSSSADISNGQGTSYLYITTGQNQFVKSSTTYLNFTLDVVLGTGATGPSNSFGFNGPCMDCSSLISQMQLSMGSVNETVNYFPIVSQMMTLQKQNKSYFQTDHKAQTGAMEQYYKASGPGINWTLNLSIAVPVGVLNSIDNYLCTSLFANPPQLLINWNSNVNSCFTCGTGQSIVSWKIRNVSLMYTAVNVQPDYLQEIKRLMVEEDFKFSFSAQDITCIAVQDAPTINQIIGVNAQSLSQVLYTNFTTPTSVIASPAQFSPLGQTVANLFIDNVPIVQSLPMNVNLYASHVYSTARASVGQLFDGYSGYAQDISNPGATLTENSLASPYLSANFVGGFPVEAFNQDNIFGGGTPCMQARVEITHTSTPASSLYIMYCRDVVFTIDAGGNVSAHF